MMTRLLERKPVPLSKLAPLAALACLALGAAVLVAGAAKLLAPALNYGLTVGVVAAALFAWLAGLLRRAMAEDD